MLLRLSDFTELDRKKNEYEKIMELSNFDIQISKALDFGFSQKDNYVYMLLSWVEGEDAENKLKYLDDSLQYNLGFQAGKILQKIHSITRTVNTEKWETVYTKKVKRVVEAYKNCNV